MKKLDNIPSKHFILGALFVVTNRLDTQLSRTLKEFGVTTKQWFLSITVDSVFDKPPTMKQAARQMGCSHQNAKQVALKLKQKGLLKMEKDENDNRVTRMNLTKESDKLWEKINPKGDEFIGKVFDGISQEDMDTTRKTLHILMMNLDKMDDNNL